MSLRFAVVASLVVAMLAGASYYAWQRRPSVVHEFDWGRSITGNGVLNAVNRIEKFDAERGRFSYYTGARAGDSGPRLPAPTRALAEAAHGSVSVRLLGFDAYEGPRASEEALELARVVSAATTDVFPGAAIPVEIDLHFMPEDARFSLAKRVAWHQGRPYALAVFTREHVFVPATAVHELYHVLATRWSLRDTPEATRRSGAASSYEEAAAELYAACGQLLANERLPREAPAKDRVVIADPVRGDQAFDGALAGDEVVAVLDLMQSGARGAGFIGFGPLLAATVFEHVFGESTVITLDSPQAARLLALCRDAAANPFAIEAWLAALGPAAGDAILPTARVE